MLKNSIFKKKNKKIILKTNTTFYSDTPSKSGSELFEFLILCHKYTNGRNGIVNTSVTKAQGQQYITQQPQSSRLRELILSISILQIIHILSVSGNNFDIIAYNLLVIVRYSLFVNNLTIYLQMIKKCKNSILF
tara:strand:+ start:134 stop:535 length:402 start_codon:yes stop_codon:yes gene_type:complete